MRPLNSPLGQELALALVYTEPPDCVLEETHAPYRGVQTNVGAGHTSPPEACLSTGTKYHEGQVPWAPNQPAC